MLQPRLPDQPGHGGAIVLPVPSRRSRAADTAVHSRRVLVTGARGFVGTHMRAALAARWPEAEVTSLAATAEPGFVTANLLDPAALDAAVAVAAPDVVIHLAAQSSVARSLGRRGEVFAVNVGGSLNLALAVARRAPGATVLFASSGEVYGSAFADGPVDEASPTLPINDYGRSKLLAERMFAAVLPATARLLVARSFGHTGPGQGEDFVFPSFAAQIARIEAGRGTQLRVGNLDLRRDVQDVRDVVQAYLDLIEAAPDLPHRFTCNVASGEARPLRAWLDALRALAACPIAVAADPARMRPAEVPVACGDAGRLRRATGWRPRHAFTTTLSDLLAGARANLAAA